MSVRARLRAYVRECVRACVREGVCVCVCVCVFLWAAAEILKYNFEIFVDTTIWK